MKSLLFIAAAMATLGIGTVNCSQPKPDVKVTTELCAIDKSAVAQKILALHAALIELKEEFATGIDDHTFSDHIEKIKEHIIEALTLYQAWGDKSGLINAVDSQTTNTRILGEMHALKDFYTPQLCDTRFYQYSTEFLHLILRNMFDQKKVSGWYNNFCKDTFENFVHSLFAMIPHDKKITAKSPAEPQISLLTPQTINELELRARACNKIGEKYALTLEQSSGDPKEKLINTVISIMYSNLTRNYITLLGKCGVSFSSIFEPSCLSKIKKELATHGATNALKAIDTIALIPPEKQKGYGEPSPMINDELQNLIDAIQTEDSILVELYVNILKKKGQDLNTVDQFNFSPIHYAAITGNDEIIAILLNNGANKALAHSRGITPNLLGKSKLLASPFSLDGLPNDPPPFWQAINTADELGIQIIQSLIAHKVDLSRAYQDETPTILLIRLLKSNKDIPKNIAFLNRIKEILLPAVAKQKKSVADQAEKASKELKTIESKLAKQAQLLAQQKAQEEKEKLAQEAQRFAQEEALKKAKKTEKNARRKEKRALEAKLEEEKRKKEEELQLQEKLQAQLKAEQDAKERAQKEAQEKEQRKILNKNIEEFTRRAKTRRTLEQRAYETALEKEVFEQWRAQTHDHKVKRRQSQSTDYRSCWEVSSPAPLAPFSQPLPHTPVSPIKEEHEAVALHNPSPTPDATKSASPDSKSAVEALLLAGACASALANTSIPEQEESTTQLHKALLGNDLRRVAQILKKDYHEMNKPCVKKTIDPRTGLVVSKKISAHTLICSKEMQEVVHKYWAIAYARDLAPVTYAGNLGITREIKPNSLYEKMKAQREQQKPK